MATAAVGTPGGVGYVNPFAATAQPNNGSSAPTIPASVPTTAPTGTTSTSAPAATPTAVVSSNTAANQVNNVIKPALDQGKAAIAMQTANNAAAVAANPYSLQPGETTAAYNTRIATYNASKTPTTPVTPPTPEQQIADTPPDNHTWIYNTTTGERAPLAIGTALPAGYQPTKPGAAPVTPVTDQTTDPVGNVYKQFSDGTYGKFNPMGEYIGTATQSEFTNSKNGETALDSLNKLSNGTFPLTPNEQAQVDDLKASFQLLIKQQETANANLTGGTTVAMNLYGMGNSVSGLGEIKGTIDSGLAKIADLNSKMSSAVSAMEAGFRNDDIKAIQAAYTAYSDTVKARQSELDVIKKSMDDALQRNQDEVDKQNQIKATQAAADKQIAATRQDQADNDIRSVIAEAQKGNATPDQIKQMQTALTNHDYGAAVEAAVNTLQDPTSPAGQYSAYVNKQRASGKPVMSAGDFLAAQKYKEAYASASASAVAQGAFASSDKNQSKLEHQLQQAALSSRSDLGIQNKKLSVAVDLRTMLNQFKQPDGTYKVPRTNYTELAVGLATLLSPTGIPAQSIVQDLQQKTAAGDLAGAITYATGVQQTGTTQDILKTLSESIDRQGQTAEVLRNQQLAAQTPSDLDQSRADAVIGKLPSYDKMSHGDIAYQSPEAIATTAKTNVQSLVTSDPSKASMIQEMLKVPGSSYTTVAEKLGLLPSTTK